MEFLDSIRALLDAEQVVRAGYGLMTLIVFVETGLLIGFCLPGDSLLVTAGLFAARGDLDLLLINALLIPAAILGDSLGYAIGYRSGPRLFRRERSLLFRPEHLVAAHQFYEKHGGRTIILARFVPIIRTFAPVVAGMGQMSYRKFLAYNVVGGVLWISSLSTAGYLLGQAFPGAIKRLELIIVAVIFISILPGIVSVGRRWLASRSAAEPVARLEAEGE